MIAGHDTTPTFSLLGVRADGDEDGGAYWFPVVDPDATVPRLEPGESVHLQLWVDLSGEGGGSSWKLPNKAAFAITDRRVTFVCRQFIDSGGYVGVGFLGLAAATIGNVASSRRAATSQAGRAAVGHLRFEWLSSVRLIVPEGTTGIAGWIAGILGAVLLTVTGPRGPFTLWVMLPKGGDPRQFARRLVQTAASHQLRTRLASLTEDDIDRLGHLARDSDASIEGVESLWVLAGSIPAG